MSEPSQKSSREPPETAGRIGTLARAMAFMTGGVLLSRVLGLVRDVLLAEVWGTEAALAAFLIAFTLPNLLRNLFGEGAFSAAFVPVISHRLETEGPARAWDAAARIISVLAVVLAGCAAAGVAAALAFQPFVPSGLWRNTLALVPWLLPYTLFVCLTAAFGAVLYVLRRFGAPSLASAFLNLAFITAAGISAAMMLDPDTGVRVLCGAVLCAGAVQLAYVAIWARRRGFRFHWNPDFSAPEVRQVARLMAPAALGAGVLQLNVMADRLLAGWLGAAATTSLYYSQRLVYLPVGLFGVALGAVSLPALSQSAARGDAGAVAARLRAALRLGLFLSLPCAVFLAGGGEAVVRLLFERGRFDDAAVHATVWPLLFYVPGIPAFVAAKIAVTPFYAAEDTATPVRISLFCLGLNVVLNLILMQFLKQGGLALATTLCSFTNVFLLLRTMKRHTGELGLFRESAGFLRTVGAGAIGAAGLILARIALVRWFGPQAAPGLPGRIGIVLWLGMATGVGYLAGAGLFRCTELQEILGLILRRKPASGT